MKKIILLSAVFLFILHEMISGQVNLCEESEPICTGPVFSYPAGTTGSAEPGAYYGCLQTQPAPAWFHMLIEDPGDITIYMYSNPLVDIDFICWGPFANPHSPCVAGLTSGTVVDCSYSPNPTEYCDLTEVLAGEYYILMITNYSQQPTEITFSQTAGNGSLDCAILNPMDVNFTANPTSGPPPLIVNFLDQSTGEPTSWKWDFQNDGTYDAFEQNPYFIYAEAGIYSVKLWAENQYETDSIVYIDYITITEPDILVTPISLTITEGDGQKGQAPAGPAFSDTLTIQNTGTSDLTISEISAAEPWILASGYPQAPFILTPGAGQDVLVDIDWPQLEGMTQTGTISVFSNDPDESPVEVPVTAVPLSQPDLVVQNPIVSPGMVIAGDTMFIAYDVVNLGNGDAGGSNLRYFLSPDNVFDSIDIELGFNETGIIDAGMTDSQVDTVTIPPATDPGTWYILFFADADQQLEESNEANNLSQAIFTVDTATWIISHGSGAETPGIRVYPNPGRDRVVIDYSALKIETADVEIFNQAGILIKTMEIPTHGRGIILADCSKWPPGSYFIRITSGGKIFHKVMLISG